MNFDILIPIVAIVASAVIVIQILKYMQARRAGGGTAEADSSEARENAQLARENDLLRLTVGRLEQRMAVLERIATDPAERTAREIESLR